MSFDAKSSNKVIYKIRPALGGTYLLGDIIKAFGEPSHISAIISKFPDYEHVRSTPSPSGMTAIITNYDLGLLYLPQGFITGNTSSIKPSLGPNLALYPPVFFLPTLEGYAKALNKKQQDLDLFAPWQGFRDFDYYCRNLPDMSTCPR